MGLILGHVFEKTKNSVFNLMGLILEWSYIRNYTQFHEFSARKGFILNVWRYMISIINKFRK